MDVDIAEDERVGQQPYSGWPEPLAPGGVVDVEVQMLVAGTVLAGRYRLVEQLGAGGMGVVWRATDEVLGRTVAVKILKPELLADPDAARRFRTEAQAMATVEHPGVVGVYDFLDDSAGALLVMGFLAGEALSTILGRERRLSPERTMALVVQAADALHAAHERGIVHRDVKPSNLLVRSGGAVVLTDFGVAWIREGTQLTATGAILGTPSYLAPEQVLGQPITARCDVYALGLVAYRCLTGQQAFDRAGPWATAIARVHEPPPTFAADVPPAVALVLERALARDPAERWSSAADLAIACRATATGPPSAAQPPPAAGPATELASAITTTELPAKAPAGATRLPADPDSPPPPDDVQSSAASKKRIRWIGAGLATVVTIAAGAAAIWITQSPADDPIGPSADQPVDRMTGHTLPVRSVAIGELENTPIVVSSSADETVRVWDLTSGTQLGQALTGHTESVRAVAVGELEGTPVAVSASEDKTVRVWDLTSGAQLGEPLTGHTESVQAVAVGELEGTPIAVSASEDETVWVWDLTRGEQLGQPLTGHTDWVRAVAVGELEGTPVAVSGSDDGTVRVWDLASGEQLGQPLTGHTDWVRAVAAGEIEDTPIAVSGSNDRTVRVWYLTRDLRPQG